MAPSIRTPDADGLPLDPSDAEIIEAVRAGDTGDFALLWRRHAEPARRAARAISPSADADDLVSEAFASILRVTKSGGGPRDAFRPYLLATLRNTAARWAREGGMISIDTLPERELAPGDDPIERISERSSIAAVFTRLSPRHRTLLWYLEVEGLKPRELAPILGMSPNAVSALALRARESFRRAWLEAHIHDASRPADCRWFCERVVSRRERPIRGDDAVRFAAHADACRGCQVVAAEIDTVSRRLRSILPAALIGGSAAAVYLGEESAVTRFALAGSAPSDGTPADAGDSSAMAVSNAAPTASPFVVPALAAFAVAATVVTGAVFYAAGSVEPAVTEARISSTVALADQADPFASDTEAVNLPRRSAESDAVEVPRLGPFPLPDEPIATPIDGVIDPDAGPWAPLRESPASAPIISGPTLDVLDEVGVATAGPEATLPPAISGSAARSSEVLVSLTPEFARLQGIALPGTAIDLLDDEDAVLGSATVDASGGLVLDLCDLVGTADGDGGDVAVRLRLTPPRDVAVGRTGNAVPDAVWPTYALLLPSPCPDDDPETER